jgi:hypothetical protein
VGAVIFKNAPRPLSAIETAPPNLADFAALSSFLTGFLNQPPTILYKSCRDMKTYDHLFGAPDTGTLHQAKIQKSYKPAAIDPVAPAFMLAAHKASQRLSD